MNNKIEFVIFVLGIAAIVLFAGGSRGAAGLVVLITPIFIGLWGYQKMKERREKRKVPET